MATIFKEKDDYKNCRSEADARKMAEIMAAEQATRLDYEGQHIVNEEENLTHEEQSVGGIQPQVVQQSNLTRGAVISLLGGAVWAVHFKMGLWALSWLDQIWVAYAFSFGLSACGAAGTAFFLQGILKIFRQHEHDAYRLFILFLAALMMLMSMFCSAQLGIFRAELMAKSYHEESAPIILEGEQPKVSSSDTVSRFYEKCLPMLALIMPILAILADLGSGVLLHTGMDKVITSTVSLRMLRRRENLNHRKLENATLQDTINLLPEKMMMAWRGLQEEKNEIKSRQQERTAYRTTAQWRNKKIAVGLVSFMLAVITLLVFATRVWPDTVVGIDVSLSEKRTSVTGHASLERRKKAIEGIVQVLEPGEKFFVVAVTASTCVDPWVILSARLNEKPGYFKERLKRDRAIITASWRKTAKKLKLFARQTDLLGFFHIAGELLAKSTNKKIFVLSDGMHCTADLNLEKVPQKPTDFTQRILKIVPISPLKDAEVTFLGAGGSGITRAHLNALKFFWKTFIERSGGTLERFSSLMEVSS